MREKIKDLKELSIIIRKLRKEGKEVGFITGCFDILHLDHIRLFQFAKNHVDVLIVAIENDKNVKQSKGEGRPIFTDLERAEVVSNLEPVDYVIIHKKVNRFGTQGSKEDIFRFTKKLLPTALITNPLSDTYSDEKYERAKKLGLKVFVWRKKVRRPSSYIISKLEKE